MDDKQLNEWMNSRQNRKALYDHKHLFEAIREGDIGALSRAITLLESLKPNDRNEAQKLIKLCLANPGESVRIGITGVPGVGKSTFIESFGMELIAQGKKVAVLAIDPSSEKTRGSILGDKTRMEKLSTHKKAFIRPSPAGESLGGVARKTRETAFLCELAGFDVILIETVGVGQSETSVHSMVDFFLLLMLSGAGDELQGIKRGIMEMADLLVVTKADGENIKQAKIAQREYKNALHLFPPNENSWVVQAVTSSSFNNQDVQRILAITDEYVEKTKLNGSFDLKRKNQDLYWLDETLKELILDNVFKKDGFTQALQMSKESVLDGQMSSFQAAENIFKKFS